MHSEERRGSVGQGRGQYELRKKEQLSFQLCEASAHKASEERKIDKGFARICGSPLVYISSWLSREKSYTSFPHKMSAPSIFLERLPPPSSFLFQKLEFEVH